MCACVFVCVFMILMYILYFLLGFCNVYRLNIYFFIDVGVLVVISSLDLEDVSIVAEFEIVASAGFSRGWRFQC